MATIHISESEAPLDLPGLIDKVRAGDEVAVQRGPNVVAVIRKPLDEFKPRKLSEALAIAEALAQARGYDAIMDEDFAADLEEIIRDRAPWNPPKWD